MIDAIWVEKKLTGYKCELCIVGYVSDLQGKKRCLLIFSFNVLKIS